MSHRYSIRPRTLFFAAALGLGTVSVASAQHASPTAAMNAAITQGQQNSEAAFLAEGKAAMNKMMAGMAIQPTGDVDRDFVEMMVPHHQSAIDMAESYLRYGHNEQLRQLAQRIIVAQQREIATMRQTVGQPLATPQESTPMGGGMQQQSTPMPGK
jgi:uncharacterized protein (DUF305 family)